MLDLLRSLVILPLDKSGKEQFEKISRLSRARPCRVKQRRQRRSSFKRLKPANIFAYPYEAGQALGKELCKSIYSPRFQKKGTDALLKYLRSRDGTNVLHLLYYQGKLNDKMVA